MVLPPSLAFYQIPLMLCILHSKVHFMSRENYKFFKNYAKIIKNESSIMKLATLLYSKKIVSLSLSKSVISFDNRLEAVRLSGQG